MKFLLPLLLLVLLRPTLHAQTPSKDILGAWESTFVDGEGRRSKLTMTIVEGFMVMTAYNADSGEFISSLGGRWRADWDNFSLTYEFDSSDSTQVGGVAVIPYELTGSILIFNKDKFWTRTDKLESGALAGAWEITGRKRNGTMQDLSDRRDGPRKTMKILSGTRFQWIAFNTATKEFIATGGGSYSTNEAGRYVEKIEFFSRDPSRVGKQLSFDFERINRDWIHQGLSSKGDPVHEVWSLRK
jgi:hypothetical protein